MNSFHGGTVSGKRRETVTNVRRVRPSPTSMSTELLTGQHQGFAKMWSIASAGFSA
jgi:hypothetical protein